MFLDLPPNKRKVPEDMNFDKKPRLRSKPEKVAALVAITVTVCYLLYLMMVYGFAFISDLVYSL